MADTKTVLLVDDDEVLRNTLGSALEGAGYKVLLAEDGKTGIETAFREHPDLILLDYQMPNMDGIEVLRQLRADEWGAKVPVIFETNVYDLHAVNEILRSGVKDYLMKSDMSLDSLLALVKKYLQN